MIVRTANRSTVDYGPAPARVDGLDSITAMALRAEVYVAPVERRYLSPEELAAIREQDEPQPTGKGYGVMAEKVTPAELAARRARGGQATANAKRARSEAYTALLWSLLRETNGNMSEAARRLGTDPNNLAASVRRRRHLMPADIAPMIRRGGRAPGTYHHSPETRALIGIRSREARKAAAA